MPQRAGGVESRAGPAPKRRRSAACYAWNDGRACEASPCSLHTFVLGVVGSTRSLCVPWLVRAVALPVAPSELADGETSAIRNSYWADGETSGPMWYLSVAVAAFFFFLCCTAAVAALNILDLCLGAALYDYVI